jgi:hypothetical protein
MLDMRKFLISCVCSVALLTSLAVASTDSFTNGGFNGSDTGWTFEQMSGYTGIVTGSYYATDGNPIGCGLVQSVDLANATNNHRYYQQFAVVPGNVYYLRGQWKGNIQGQLASGNAASRNWAEVYVVFSPVPLTAADANWTTNTNIRYKKAYGNGNLNTSTGTWGWESILISPSTENAGPADGGFMVPTGMNYMAVGFNLGGRASSVGSTDISQATSVWYMVDNVHVCSAYSPTGDINGDCSVNFIDVSYITNKWLSCGLDPQTSCY